jgi:16S rRNA (adenine1518-N6/adenine1519-N6)-dimethyltransferase
VSPGDSFEDPRRVLARHGLVPKKRFSQNFLISKSIPLRIVGALGIRPGDLVAELGAGLGTLTGALLRASAKVVAVESDRDMVRVLRAELSAYGAALAIREEDASAVDLTAIAGAGSIHVAGNLPYAITGRILRNVAHHAEAISRAVLMIQKEVKERLVAEPSSKEYGALTVFLRRSFNVDSVCTVSRRAFHPMPRVDSAVVRLERLRHPRATRRPEFDRIVRAVFSTRRKTLRNSLKTAGVPLSPVLEAGIDAGRRGETLTIEEFDRMAEALAAAER